MIEEKLKNTMGRTAEYTIEGFMYQFQVTLDKILSSSDNDIINIEGVIEDIDIITPSGTTAVQCKYHSTVKNFTLSAIYKPVLQMMTHYKNNRKSNITYRLFAHFPSETTGKKQKLLETDILSILSSTSKELTALIAGLSSFTEYKKFLKKFEIEFGPSYEDNEKKLKLLLATESGLSKEDIEQIFYPNSVNKIAELSILHDANKRKISKKDFISAIKSNKKTIISRWTKELQSYETLLKKRKAQLRENLNKNARVRCIILDADYIKDFDIKAVGLIEDFIGKYNYKIHLHEIPIFVLSCDDRVFDEICEKLHYKKIDVERGLIANKLNPDRFLREPIKNLKQGKIEFVTRLCKLGSEFDSLLPIAKFDDLILISDKEITYVFPKANVNIEKIQTQDMKEIKYLLSLTTNL